MNVKRIACGLCNLKYTEQLSFGGAKHLCPKFKHVRVPEKWHAFCPKIANVLPDWGRKRQPPPSYKSSISRHIFMCILQCTIFKSNQRMVRIWRYISIQAERNIYFRRDVRTHLLYLNYSINVSLYPLDLSNRMVIFVHLIEQRPSTFAVTYSGEKVSTVKGKTSHLQLHTFKTWWISRPTWLPATFILAMGIKFR